MKERPILVQGWGVRAILDGRKTMTRRVAKTNSAGRVQYRGRQWHLDDPNAILACPYGVPGDRLWVRETWYPCTCGRKECTGAIYRADGEPALDGFTWRPSIHMPRDFSRIILDVTGVRVERVQDISEEDAVAEGTKIPLSQLPKSCQQAALSECQQFARLWDSTNSKRGFGWDANPWVWVVGFRRIAQQGTKSGPGATISPRDGVG